MSALFSSCGQYRYRLKRQLTGTTGPLLLIGLNPSTADASRNDPTIRRCIGFADLWGHSELVVTNLFSFRATKPAALKAADAPIGPDTDAILLEEAQRASRILVAWGMHGGFQNRDQAVLELLSPFDLSCLGKTKAGFPRHPLYMRANTQPIPYSLK
jgi:hypothetical protein